MASRFLVHAPVGSVVVAISMDCPTTIHVPPE
jgi:hypothetical protein